jgi:hypothetical protein
MSINITIADRAAIGTSSIMTHSNPAIHAGHLGFFLSLVGFKRVARGDAAATSFPLSSPQYGVVGEGGVHRYMRGKDKLPLGDRQQATLHSRTINSQNMEI